MRMAKDAERHGLCHIDKQLVSLKAIYFTFLAAIGDLLPFVPIYMKQLGLSSTETGIIYGAMPFIAFFVRPVFGLIADKTHRHRLVLIICCVMTGICYCLLLLTPEKDQLPWKPHVQTTLRCGQQDSFIKDCVNMDERSQSGQNKQSCKHSLQSFYDQYAVNSTGVKCKFMCSVSFSSDMNIEACFTNDVGPLYADNCKEIWDDSTVKHLKFSIQDLTNLMENKIDGENKTYSGQVCQNYNLKNVTYTIDSYWQFVCSVDSIMKCSVSCDVAEGATCLIESSELSMTFWVFFIIFLFSNIFFSPVLSLVDGIAYDILGEKRGRWGMQRLWGSIGFILLALTSSLIMDYRARSGDSVDYSVSFYIFGGLCLSTGIVACFLKFDENIQCNQMFKDFTQLMKLPQVVFFFCMMTFFGILNAVIEGFLFWYLKDLGSSQIVLGLCLVFDCIPEVLMLFFSGKIIKKIGHVNCLYLSAIAYAVRFFYYSFLTNPWYVLIVEPFHCFTYALFYASASSYVSIITPPGMSGTAQGLLGGIYFGLAKGIGSLITGKMFDPVNALGPVWTFRFFGFFSIFTVILYFTIQTIFFRKSEVPVPDPKIEVEGETADKLLEPNGEACVNTVL